MFSFLECLDGETEIPVFPRISLAALKTKYDSATSSGYLGVRLLILTNGSCRHLRPKRISGDIKTIDAANTKNKTI